MTESDCGVAIEKQVKQRQAYQRAPTDHNHSFAFDLNVEPVQDLQDSRGSAGHKSGSNILYTSTPVTPRQAIHIFVWVYLLDELLCIVYEQWSQRKLQQNPRDFFCLVKIVDKIGDLIVAEMGFDGREMPDIAVAGSCRDYFFEGVVVGFLVDRILQELMKSELDTDRGGQVYFFLNVGERGRVEAYIDDIQPRMAPLGECLVEGRVIATFQLDNRLNLGNDLSGELISVYQHPRRSHNNGLIQTNYTSTQANPQNGSQRDQYQLFQRQTASSFYRTNLAPFFLSWKELMVLSTKPAEFISHTLIPYALMIALLIFFLPWQELAKTDSSLSLCIQ